MEDGGRIELAKRALALIGIPVWDPLRLKKIETFKINNSVS